MPNLFDSITIGGNELANRIVLAPMTRLRADRNLCPTNIHVEYYSQRTDGNLIISEGAIISPHSIGYHAQPGIFTDKQVAQWKLISDAVRSKGGLLSIQIWHQGRLAHSSFTEHPLAKAAGAIVCESSSVSTYDALSISYRGTKLRNEASRAMTLEDIARVKRDYVQAAKNAVSIGAIAEIHGAHGYLLDQFHNDGVNKRTDQYGGCIENRIRFTLELLRDMVAAVGAKNIAIRISPHDNTHCFFDCTDSNPVLLYTTLLKAINKEFSLAYILITEIQLHPTTFLTENTPISSIIPCNNLLLYRPLITNSPVIGSAGYTPQTAEDIMNFTNTYDLVGFGRYYISNPDLIYRLRYKLPLTDYLRETFYTNTSDGYTDYPTFIEICAKAGYTVDQVLQDSTFLDKVIEYSQSTVYKLLTLDTIGTTTSSEQRKQQSINKQAKL